jgi:uncharacterized membrane protein YfcA
VELTAVDHVLAAAAAVGAGVVNAVAGGGTLISFPALVGLGVPSVRANVTNTVALCPGYFGGATAQRDDLRGQRRRTKVLSIAAAAGGLVGSVLLVVSSEKLFNAIVPFLVLLACALLAFQDRIRLLLPMRVGGSVAPDAPPATMLVAAVFASSIYGGYFGAGLGIVNLAVLGLLIDDRLSRLNALKQVISLVTNGVAALFFVFSGKAVWSLVAVMAPASLVGGAVGGRLARRMHPRLMRALVVLIGLAVAIGFWAT